MRQAHDRRRGSIVGALLLFACCGRSDLLPGLAGGGTGGTAGTSGTLGAGEANGTGGDRAIGGGAGSGATVGTGGSSGGGGNTGTSAASGGATEPCSTIAELPADAKAICTYTGDYANLQEVSNCPNAHVTIYSAALGTQPIACSADNSTYTFNDLDGQRLSITFGIHMNIIRVQP